MCIIPKCSTYCMNYVLLFLLKNFREIYYFSSKALVLFTTLSYIHFTFSKNPMDCLEKYHNNWPKDGILQVQILKNQVKLAKQSSLPPFFASKWNHSFILGDTTNGSTMAKDGQCPLEQKHNGRISHEVELKDNDMDPVFVDTAVIDEGYLLKRETVFYEKKIQATQTNRFPLYSSYFPSMQRLIHCKYFEILWHFTFLQPSFLAHAI